MAIRDDILTLKNKEGTLAGNKVCNFAYDDTAFEDDTTTGANGVSTYNYNNHNNIPVKDVEVLKVNPTIISKGFRSQVSTLSRMLLNHIFGRVSYNLNKTVDTLNSLLTNLYTYIGQPNGLATLDNTGRLPYSQLPLSAVEYKGAWNADTNTPTLASGTGTFGDEYIVSTQGTQNIGEGSITYRVGDRVIYNGSIWQRIPASSLRTVNSKSPDADGNVTINASDIVTPDVYGYNKTNIGESWTKDSDTTTSSFKVVYYANGMWVASSNVSWWSTDGINWNASINGSRSFSAVYFAGIWVACNATIIGLSWSVDGKAWFSGMGNYTFNCVYYANGIWVAGSSGYGLYWSNNGKSWSAQTGGGADTINCIYYADTTQGIETPHGIWVAGSANNGLWWSSDGKSWTQGTDAQGGNSTTYTFKCIYHADGIWVAGSASHGLYWSTDGQSWTHATGFYGADFATINCVYYADGRWVAGGSTGLYTSTDGKAWTRSYYSITHEVYNCIYYANGKWVAGSSGHGLAWSTDGQNWTQGTGATTDTFKCVYYGNGVWVAGSDGDGLWYSEGTLTNNVKAILDWLIHAVDNLLD